MKNARIILQTLILTILATVVMPPGIPAQEAAEQEQAERFKKEELAQMLAPIALYPDSLIAQILMASTYPLEIVEAERWLRRNQELKGDALNEALKDKTWDSSVKSLCHFPDVLFALSDKLEQTRKLGDAYLNQEEDVTATIQELRHRASEQGNLKTTSEQKVIVEREVISIVPADPQYVYVPVYDPFYVYGPWWYPAYPPYYWYFPARFVVAEGHIIFGPRIFIGIGLFSWTWFGWHRHVIVIDHHRAPRFHRHFAGRDYGRPYYWKHDPRHRRGVAYRDRRVGERFGQQPLRRPAISTEPRGFLPGGVEGRAAGVSRGPVDTRQRTVTPQVRPERGTLKRAPTRDTPFRGVGDGSFERRAGERGRESRRDGEIRRSGGERSMGGATRQQSGGGRGARQGGGSRR